LIDHAQGFFDFLLDRLTRQQDAATDRGRLAIVRAMGEAVAKTGNAVLFDTYAQKTAQRLRVTPDAIRTEFRRLARRGAPEARTRPGATDDSPPTGGDAQAPARPSPQEFWLLKLLLLDDATRGWTRHHLDLAWIQHAGVRRMVGALLETPAGGAQEVATLIGGLEDEHDRGLASEAVAERRPVPNQTQQIVDLVQRLRDQQADRDLAALTQDLAREDLSEVARRECLRRQQSLRELKRRPLPPPGSSPAAPPSVNAEGVERGDAIQGGGPESRGSKTD
jgi:DNA primase